MINPETHHATIIDFGLADFITAENNGLFNRRVGSEEYCPVELIEKNDKPFDGRKVDVYCLGVVLYALLSAQFPIDIKKRKEAIRSGKTLPGLRFNFDASEECRDLIAKMLENNPEKRISVEEIMQHKWLL